MMMMLNGWCIIQMLRWFIVIVLVVAASSVFCVSKCTSNSISHCRNNGPRYCTQCLTTYYSSFSFPCGSTLRTTLTLIEDSFETQVASLWTVNTLNSAITCTMTSDYSSAWTYTFYNKLVGDDFIHRTIDIITPHYQFNIRFSIAYIGVWSTSNDYLWLHMDDTLQNYNYNLSYSCPLTTTGTDPICNKVLPSGGTNAYNGVDCLQHYEFTVNHNTTSMLANFTYPNTQRDSSIKFWNLYDVLITVNHCDSKCAQCYGPLNTQCFSCTDNNYYFDNNTCLTVCPVGTLLQINPSNPLTGQCLYSCPQGYYTSGINCLACASGCLVCTDASTCVVSSNVNQESLWSKFLVLWVILMVVGVFFLVGLVWYIVTPSAAVHQTHKLVPQVRQRAISYQDRATVHQTLEGAQPYNFHIQEIDYKDNVMVDNNPRVRRRMERDNNRSALQ